MTIFQVVLGTGATQFPALQSQPQFMTVQNNTSDNMRIGDKTVTSSKGIALGPGGSLTFSLGLDYATRVSEFWVIGTAADVLDVMVI
jgi:hypothetical protein